MIVDKEIFDNTKIGDSVWQYFYDKSPQIIKTVISGKRIQNGCFELQFHRFIRISHVPNYVYFKESDAKEAYKEGLATYYDQLQAKISSLNDSIDNFNDHFDSIQKDTLQTVIDFHDFMEVKLRDNVIIKY